MIYTQEPRKNKQVTFILPPDIYDKFLDLAVSKQLLPNEVFQQLVKDYVNNNKQQTKINYEVKQKGFIL